MWLHEWSSLLAPLPRHASLPRHAFRTRAHAQVDPSTWHSPPALARVGSLVAVLTFSADTQLRLLGFLRDLELQVRFWGLREELHGLDCGLVQFRWQGFMAMGVTSLLGRSAPGAACYDYQTKLPDVAASTRCSMSLGASISWRRDLSSWSSVQFDPLRHAVTTRTSQEKVLRSKRLTVAAAPDSSNGSSESGKARQKTRAKEDVATLREKVSDYIEKKSGYFWLGGPVLATAAVFIPPAIIPLVQLLQKNYLAGLLATFGLDILFVLAADLFFVLADKAGHHQTIAGGSPPWIGPWEYTGYPKGEPVLTKLVAYAGVAIGLLGVVLSLFVGKLAVGLPAFGSYLALIFVQVAYERLLSNDRVPAYPLVPLVYTMYRFVQLARATELVAVMGGGAPLAFIIKLLTVVWTFYLGMQLTQIPWLYSTWNSNKAT